MAGRRHQMDSYSSETYERLRQALKHYELRPGTTLRIAELATRYKVSNTPLREALNRLYESNFVGLRPHLGFYVKTLDPAELGEIQELLTTLLVRGCELILSETARAEQAQALIARVAGEIEQTLELPAEQRGACAADVVEQGIREFLELAGNNVFVRHAENALIRIYFLRRLELESHERIVELLEEVREVERAVARRDLGSAKAAIHREARRTADHLSELVTRAAGRLYTVADPRP